jgi:DNA-directed RNA polymerase II subunit RPB2
MQFEQIYLSRPTMTEADGSTQPMFPGEARLRNLTYSSPLYVDMIQRRLVAAYPELPADSPDQKWELDGEEEKNKIFIGKVPIMLRSTFCILNGICPAPTYQSPYLSLPSFGIVLFWD